MLEASAGQALAAPRRWIAPVAYAAIAYTILLCSYCLWDGLRAPAPLHANLRYAAGGYDVQMIARGDLLEQAGVEVGDRIVAFDGVPFEAMLDLPERLRQAAPGSAVVFTVVRGERTLRLEATTHAGLALGQALRLLFPIATLLALGAGVWFFRPATPGTLAFLFFCLSSAINDACQATFTVGSGLQRVVTFSYALLSLLSPALLLHVFLDFPERGPVQRRLRGLLPLAYATPLALGLHYFLPTLFSGLYEQPWRENLGAVLLPAFSICVVASYGLSAASAGATALRGGSERIRGQARLLFAGLVILTVLQLGLQELPLRLRGSSLLDPFTYSLLDLVVPLFVALAIVRHRAFGIDVLVRQGLVYFCASAAVALVFVAAMGLLGWLLSGSVADLDTAVIAAVAALAAVAFHPARRWAQDAVDRVFYRRRYDYRRALTAISARLGAILDVHEAAHYIRVQLASLLDAKWVEIAARRAGEGAFELLDEQGPSRALARGEGADALARWLAGHREPFVPREGDPLAQLAPALVVPVLRGDAVLGVLLLGPRAGDTPYVGADRDFLETLASIAGTVFERGRLIEERSLRERLALVGSATSAMIHELKNPLAAIKSTAMVLRRRLGSDPRGQELTQIIEREIDRLEGSVLNVLTYVRPTRNEAVALELLPLLRQLVAVVEPEFAAAGVSVDLRVEEPLPVLRGDPARLRQLFLNLMLNAREAMPRGGRVTIEAHPVSAEGGAAAGAEVSIADTGGGIPAEHMERLFEPFFTTKRLGTGLGLVNVRRIAEEHGGKVTAANGASGAVMTVRLPGGDRVG